MLANFIYGLDLLGTLVFAISGVYAAVEKKFDVVGALVLAFVTALGGGTLRDILIGETPVSWMKDMNYIYIILMALPISYFGNKMIHRLRKSLFLFDTIGIALFTILGVQKTLALGLAPQIAVLMGVVSAVFGGVIRDVLSNKEPLIFRKEIYATACFIGALLYLLGHYLIDHQAISMLCSMIVVIIIRYLAVSRQWTLQFNPKF